MSEINTIIYESIIIIVITLIVFLFSYYFIKTIKHIYFWYWVPFVPSNNFKIDKLLEKIELKPWDKFIDIWCWDWKILEAVKKNYPENEVYWIENSPDIYKLAIKRKQKNWLDYKIIKWNFFKEDFSKYNKFYTFMIPYLMPKIWLKIRNECKKWTKLYSNAYQIKWEENFKKVEIKKDKYKSYLYVYEV